MRSDAVPVAPVTPASAVYDRVAPWYRLLHRLWLALGGERTVATLVGCCLAELSEGARYLDAGCGEGNMVRRLAPFLPDVRTTLADGAPAMLARTRDIDAERHVADIRSLPFRDGEFDLVTCCWVLEVLSDRDRSAAVGELIRVLRPGGLLCLAVCTFPTSPWAQILSAPTRFLIETFFEGRFLTDRQIAGIETIAGRRSNVIRFHGGLSAAIVIRKPG